MRRFVVLAVILLAPLALLSAQPPTTPRFEVASVKPDPKQDRGGPQKLGEFTLSVVQILPGGRIESVGNMLRSLIAWAYEVNGLYQKLVGTQDVLDVEFNISAKAAAASLTTAEARVMMRTLLEERFQLRWHLQPREGDSYLLMPARDDGQPGPALRPFSGADCAARAANPSVPFDSPDREEKGRCGWSAIDNRQRAIGQSMANVAERLTTFMMAPVSDRTGWPGQFTFDVVAGTHDLPYGTLIEQRMNADAVARQQEAPRLLEVFRRELGLKLVKERTPITDFIVDRVEPLIEN